MSSMSVHLVLLIGLLVPSLAAARDGRRAPEDWAARTKREATGLFEVVLAEMEMKWRRQPCFFDKNWSSRPVTIDVAQKYLGSNMAADLVASHLGIGPDDILDPDKAMSGSFCYKDEADRQWKEQMEAFRAGRLQGETGRYGPERLVRTRTEVSMPVFDRAFATAAIVVSFDTIGLAKVSPERAKESPNAYDENGYARRRYLNGFGYTQVYRKRRGTWVRIHTRDDWTAH